MRGSYLPRVGVAFAAVLYFQAAPAAACVPGAKVSCLCSGSWGKQVCSDDGSKLGPCDCPIVEKAPDAPVPAAAPAPAAVPTAAVAVTPLAAPVAPATPAPGARGPTAALAPDAPPVASTTAHNVLLAGIVMLATGYVISVVGGGVSLSLAAHQNAEVGGSCIRGAGWLFLPLVGAAVSAADFAKYNIVGNSKNLVCTDATGGVAAGGVVVTALQVGGAAMISASLGVSSGQDAEGSGGGAGAAPKASQTSPRFIVKPGVAGSPLGVTAGWVWF